MSDAVECLWATGQSIPSYQMVTETIGETSPRPDVNLLDHLAS